MKIYFAEAMIQRTEPYGYYIRVPDTTLVFLHRREFCSRTPKFPGNFACWVWDDSYILRMKEKRVIEPYDLLDEWTGTVAEAIEQFGLFVGE